MCNAHPCFCKRYTWTTIPGLCSRYAHVYRTSYFPSKFWAKSAHFTQQNMGSRGLSWLQPRRRRTRDARALPAAGRSRLSAGCPVPGPCCGPAPAPSVFTGRDWTGQLGRAGSQLGARARNTVKTLLAQDPEKQRAPAWARCSLPKNPQLLFQDRAARPMLGTPSAPLLSSPLAPSELRRSPQQGLRAERPEPTGGSAETSLQWETLWNPGPTCGASGKARREGKRVPSWF